MLGAQVASDHPGFPAQIYLPNCIYFTWAAFKIALHSRSGVFHKLRAIPRPQRILFNLSTVWLSNKQNVIRSLQQANGTWKHMWLTV